MDEDVEEEVLRMEPGRGGNVGGGDLLPLRLSLLPALLRLILLARGPLTRLLVVLVRLLLPRLPLSLSLSLSKSSLSS